MIFSTNFPPFFDSSYLGNIHTYMTSDVFLPTNLPTLIRCFTTYLSLFSKITCNLTYLPKNLTSYVNAPLQTEVVDWTN